LVSEAEFQKAHELELLESAQTGLSSLHALRNNGKVRDRLIAAEVDLKRISSDLALLVSYKSLHDALHEAQLRIYPQLGEEIGRFPDDPESVSALSQHIEELAVTAESADDAVKNFPSSVLRPPEEKLAGSHAAIVAAFRAAVAATDPKAARDALRSLRQLLRFQPQRLNNLLVQTARQIPVDKLVDAMRFAADTLKADDVERQKLTAAASALEALLADVHARVAEHEAWQVVDTNFWLTEDALQRNDEIAAEELSALWPMLKQQIDAICNAAEGEWINDLRRHAQDFSDACPIPAKPPVDPRARRAFQRYVHGSRLRFFRVDKDLKSRCLIVSELSTPLKELIDHV
jgi:hypothetical protein